MCLGMYKCDLYVKAEGGGVIEIICNKDDSDKQKRILKIITHV